MYENEEAVHPILVWFDYQTIKFRFDQTSIWTISRSKCIKTRNATITEKSEHIFGLSVDWHILFAGEDFTDYLPTFVSKILH